jgi:hypothetical protein
MNELAQALTGDSAVAPTVHIVKGLNEELVHRVVPNVTHTIYEELWYLAFWQQVSLDWIRGVETPSPHNPLMAFPLKPPRRAGNI